MAGGVEGGVEGSAKGEGEAMRSRGLGEGRLEKRSFKEEEILRRPMRLRKQKWGNWI